MPKNGDITWGRIVEIINPHLPIVWDDEPTKKYFAIPGQALREMVAPAKKGRYFNVPTAKPKHAGRYFTIPTQEGK
jgi:hypothetical protein